ncbi:MAG TPA: sigma-70 family RNA polymerase sigma factor [Pirellulaceae bacterium]|nr:sigma-70 family RNA polymerase sigma factor [Pirellulaceae bacterium]HMO91089.1 sigma-70 family RNA polymerase sigma factor [Pirellulaceae bacterium]HMP71188.1 sigma-70 family RNA polymerase sigma factor [Pirellulaceae bacterium]
MSRDLHCRLDRNHQSEPKFKLHWVSVKIGPFFVTNTHLLLMRYAWWREIFAENISFGPDFLLEYRDCRKSLLRSWRFCHESEEVCQFMPPGEKVLPMESFEKSIDDSHAVLAAVLQGDSSALGQLTQALRPFLKYVVHSELASGNRQVSEDDSDIVQQALSDAIAQLHNFRGASCEEWKAWLISIARNRARMSRRYWQAERRTKKRMVDPTDFSVENQPAEQSTPSSAAVRQENLARLRQALAQLPEQHQLLIQWRQNDGLSHAEIASRLGISVENSRQRCKAAMDALRRTWAESEE